MRNACFWCVAQAVVAAKDSAREEGAEQWH